MPPRVTLPKNLSAALQRLNDDELEILQREVDAEIDRRHSGKQANTVPNVLGQRTATAVGRRSSIAAMSEVRAGKVVLPGLHIRPA